MKKDIKGWKDVKLYQLQELESLPEYEDKIDMIINYLSILLNLTPSEIENMPITEILEEFKKWEFLNDKPNEKRIEIIKMNGKRYGLINFNEMTFAQMVDIEEYINDGGVIKNLHKILSVIYLPIDKYNFLTKKYTLKNYEPSDEIQLQFQQLDMSLLYPVSLFFYRIVQTYLKNSLLSLVEKKKKELKKMIMEMGELSEIQKMKHIIKLESYGIGIGL